MKKYKKAAFFAAFVFNKDAKGYIKFYLLVINSFLSLASLLNTKAAKNDAFLYFFILF